jgi:hypothetical protein
MNTQRNMGREMSEAEYAAIPALRASWVKTLVTSTPAHLRARMNDDADSDALRIGRALHCRALRPDLYPAEFVVSPKFDRRTKAGKDEAELFAATANGRTVVDAAEQHQIDAMVAAIDGHRGARVCLSNCGVRERVWTAELWGVPCKARIDAIGPDGTVVDIKTTLSAAPRAFARSCVDFGYWVQMAFYREVLAANGVHTSHAVLIAVEKSAPYGVAAYSLSNEDMDRVLPQIQRAVETFAACESSGEWPGYSQWVEDLTMPAWAAAAANGGGE